MEKQRKKRIGKYIAWGLAVVLVALLAAMPMLARSSGEGDEVKASILSGTVENATLHTQLLGGGTLQSEDAVEVTVPAEVKLTGYLVGNGDIVEKGAVIATVDPVTVMTAISQVQETMEHLQEEIEAAGQDEAPTAVKAQAAGIVKKIYAAQGDKAEDVILKHGALAVLSLDGKMAVDVETTTGLKSGDEVIVTLGSGSEATGEVESNLEGILTVVFPDEGYEAGETVTVALEGQSLGSGTMYIHSLWNAIAYSGTVEDIKVQEGDRVSSGKTLIRLEDTGHTAEFYQLTQLHRDYEELMLELFTMYQTRTLTAPASGVVAGVDQDGAYMLSAFGDYTLSLLANAPNGDDSYSYTNFIGRVQQITEAGMVALIDPQPLQINDYKDMTGVIIDTATMTQEVLYTADVPIYELQEEQWVQVEYTHVQAEDILLFAGDHEGNFVWLVRLKEAQPQEPVVPEQTLPEETVPEATAPEGTVPEVSVPDYSGIMGGMGNFGGYTGSYGGVIQEDAFEEYTLETMTVATVTSQEEMTLQITVDELDIGKLHVGQEADITVDALGGERFTALVTQVDSTGESSGGNSKFTVELTLQKSGDMLPGMTASAFFKLDSAIDVLCVPVAALVEEGTRTLIYTGYDEELQELINPVEVTVGVSDGGNAQILSGLSRGAVYYYAYYDTLVISNIPDMNDYDFF